jgi:type VI protein secretion system component VasA
MFIRHYREELSYLKDLAVEFSKAHPALAPRLSGQSPDPVVERLLEGVAFSGAMLRQKLDGEFPEVVHSLLSARLRTRDSRRLDLELVTAPSEKRLYTKPSR